LLKIFKFASKSFEGIGLGLFITQSVIEALGGEIRPVNNNNINIHGEKGDIFYFTLATLDDDLM
jgi:K+-sensing histidine kinase KdpD